MTSDPLKESEDPKTPTGSSLASTRADSQSGSQDEDLSMGESRSPPRKPSQQDVFDISIFAGLDGGDCASDKPPDLDMEFELDIRAEVQLNKRCRSPSPGEDSNGGEGEHKGKCDNEDKEVEDIGKHETKRAWKRQKS